MNPNFIPVNIPLFHGDEWPRVQSCLEEGWVSSEGPMVSEFERTFAPVVQRQHGIAVSSGTGALSVALAALELPPGSEVIMPSFTIISAAEAVLHNNLVPVLVDSLPDTWNMDPTAVEARITPRTRALLIVHIYGLPAHLDALLDIARRHDLRVVEDAAETLGQTYRGRPCGAFGDLSIFSFYPNKLITTGEGGMVVTDDPILMERCRQYRDLGFGEPRRFFHERLGWNYRLGNMAAALGLGQLAHLPEHVVRKREIGARYEAGLSSLPAFQRPPVKIPEADNLYWVYGITLDDRVPFAADEAMRLLKERGIGTRPFFWPMHEQPVLQRMGLFAGEHHPVSERLARRGFYLPSGLGMSNDQIDQVIATCHDLFRNVLPS
jgi:perosamine synthetase